MFPGEEERNARLSNLYQMANWWPQGTPKAKKEPASEAPVVSAGPVAPRTGCRGASIHHIEDGSLFGETLRDLSKISEVNQKIFRSRRRGRC